MAWQKWYEDHEIDPGLFSLKDLLALPLLPFFLVFAMFFSFIVILASLLYAIWLGVKEILAKKQQS